MEETPQDSIAEVEQLYFALAGNITIEAKNVIWHTIMSAKEYYPKTAHKAEWDSILNFLSIIINDFENQLAHQAEFKLYALQKNLDDLIRKEQPN